MQKATSAPSEQDVPPRVLFPTSFEPLRLRSTPGLELLEIGCIHALDEVEAEKASKRRPDSFFNIAVLLPAALGRACQAPCRSDL